MIRKTNEEFLKQVYDKVGDEYVFLEKYINTHTPILCYHKKCQNIFKMEPNSFLRDRKCPICSHREAGLRSRKTNEEFLREFSSVPNSEEYEILEPYITVFTKIKCRHIKCDTVWDIAPHELLKGVGCPKCKSSKGEKRIDTFLHEHNIVYISEKYFKWDKQPKKYRYDFFLPEYNIIVEYHGRQHYEETTMCHNSLKERRKDDRIKRKNAQRHNITYIVIPYWDYDKIEEILTKELF